MSTWLEAYLLEVLIYGVENPKGTLLFYREELTLNYSVSVLFREAINYGRFAILCGGGGGWVRALAGLKGRAFALALIASPCALVVAAFDRRKLKRHK